MNVARRVMRGFGFSQSVFWLIARPPGSWRASPWFPIACMRARLARWRGRDCGLVASFSSPFAHRPPRRSVQPAPHADNFLARPDEFTMLGNHRVYLLRNVWGSEIQTPFAISRAHARTASSSRRRAASVLEELDDLLFDRLDHDSDLPSCVLCHTRHVLIKKLSALLYLIGVRSW